MTSMPASMAPPSVWRTSSARCSLISLANRVAPDGAASVASRAALPPGPAHMSSHFSGPAPVGATSARLTARASSCDPSSCTAARPSRTAAMPPGSPLSSTAPTGERAERLAPALSSSSTSARPGRATRDTLARRVVGDQQGLEVGVDRLGGGRAVAEQGRPQRPHDPLRVAVQDRQAGDRVVGGHDLRDPRRQVLLADPAHHGVDEPAGTGAVDHPRQAHGLVDRGVGGDAHAEQLVGPQPQRVEDVVVDLVERPAGGRRDDRVVEAVQAGRAVGQLGREPGVTTADLLGPQLLGSSRLA